MIKLMILFFIIIFIFSVNAGEITKLDLIKGETKTVELKLKNSVELNMLDGRHIININKITDKGADLDVFVFVDDDQSISYVTVLKGSTIKLDFNKDGRGEVYISLNKFLDNGVALDFYYPKDEDFQKDKVDETNGVTGEAVLDNEKINGNPNLWIFGLIIGIIVIILIIAGIFLNKKKKGK